MKLDDLLSGNQAATATPVAVPLTGQGALALKLADVDDPQQVLQPPRCQADEPHPGVDGGKKDPWICDRFRFCMILLCSACVISGRKQKMFVPQTVPLLLKRLAQEFIFRVSHQRPSAMKRPLGFADGLTSLHVAFKVYNILEGGDGQQVATVFRADSPEVDVIELFSGSEERAKAMFSSLRVWRANTADLSILPVAGRGLVSN